MFLLLLRINFSVAIVCMTYDPEDNSTSVGNTTVHKTVIEVVDPFHDMMMSALGLEHHSDECPSDGDGDDIEEVSARYMLPKL